MNEIPTRTLLLDTAQELVQTRGYNGFSFRDLAERVRIKTASIHYHFPTKVVLARALIERARHEFANAAAAIDAEVADPFRRLERYASIFRSTLELGNRMCLCGMFAADLATLDPSIVDELRLALEDHERWLERVLAEGKRSGHFEFRGSALAQARLLLAFLEGAMLLARAFEEPRRFEAAARALMASLKTKSPA